MKFLSLRWVFLAAAAALAARCAFFNATSYDFCLAALCGLIWFGLSRRKVHSLDRESLGLRPRR
jgi:hypothetical protein